MSKDDPRSFPQIEAFFVGGVGDEVTGSSTILKIMTSDGLVRYGMIDAGAVQGNEEYRNYAYPVLGEEIDFVVLTHAHYDHVGALALLYKSGFKGPIYVNEVCNWLMTPMLVDGAKIVSQKLPGSMSKTNKLVRKMRRRLKKEVVAAECYQDKKRLEAALSQFDDAEFEPLFSKEDVEAVLEQVKIIDVNKLVDVVDGVRIRLLPTTHQNGACRVELYATDPNGSTYNMAFSGDIGPKESRLYKQKYDYTNPDIDCFVLEVLHGVKEPVETTKTSIKRLKEIIKKGIRQKKHIVLGGFSLDRNAMLVHILNEFAKEGINVPVYIDSPLTMCQLETYRKTYRTSPHWFKDLGPNPFSTDDFTVITSHRMHAEKLLHGEAPRVIITASATGGGGRIIDYMNVGIQRGDYVFVFCGWSAPDSPSSILIDAKQGEIVELPEGRFKKNCKSYRIHGLSSHGYYPEMLESLADYPKLSTIVLNHARVSDQMEVCNKFSEFFSGNLVTPDLHETYIFSKEGASFISDEQALYDFESVIDRNVIEMAYQEDDEDDEVGDVFP